MIRFLSCVEHGSDAHWGALAQRLCRTFLKRQHCTGLALIVHEGAGWGCSGRFRCRFAVWWGWCGVGGCGGGCWRAGRGGSGGRGACGVGPRARSVVWCGRGRGSAGVLGREERLGAGVPRGYACEGAAGVATYDARQMPQLAAEPFGCGFDESAAELAGLEPAHERDEAHRCPGAVGVPRGERHPFQARVLEPFDAVLDASVAAHERVDVGGAAGRRGGAARVAR